MISAKRYRVVHKLAPFTHEPGFYVVVTFDDDCTEEAPITPQGDVTADVDRAITAAAAAHHEMHSRKQWREGLQALVAAGEMEVPLQADVALKTCLTDLDA